MKIKLREDNYATFKVFADDSFDNDNNGLVYGVELHQNGEVINVEWFKTQDKQDREYNQLNKELSNGQW